MPHVRPFPDNPDKDKYYIVPSEDPLNQEDNSDTIKRLSNDNLTSSRIEDEEQPEIQDDKSSRKNSSGSNGKRSSKKMLQKVDVIGNIVGDWGKWQLRTVLLIFLVKIPSSWFMACIIFTAPAPRHGEFYCKPPTPIALHPDNKSTWVKISHPEKQEVVDKEFNIDYCNVYEDALDHVHEYYKTENNSYHPWDVPVRNTSIIIPCDSFEHHANYKSIITEFDLVCSRDILVATTQFFHLFGVLCGGILATKLLESISPRRVMMIGMVSQIICGNLTGLVNSYELHVFFRCLSAVCCAQMYTAGQMICKFYILKNLCGEEFVVVFIYLLLFF